MPSPRNLFPFALLSGLLLLALLQLSFLVYIIHETYITGPVQDSWGIIPYIKKTLTHGHWFNEELWLPQNSHRLVLLRLEFLIDYFYFHGSNVFLIGLSGLLISIESALLIWAHNIRKKPNITQWIILLSTIILISFPTIAWSFLHIFNIHMLQLAVFAVLSCTLVSKGLSENRNILFVFGIAAAVLCNLATFSVSTIWPALILLLLLNRASPCRAGSLLACAVIVSCAYLFWLPTGESGANNYSSFNSLISLLAPEQNMFSALNRVSWLLQYLIIYLSIPPTDNLFFQLITLFTLAWFVFGCYVAIKHTSHQEENTGLALMCFGICLAITTGIGRGYLGDLATGDRFQPMVLVYWTGFIIHILHYLKNRQKMSLFYSAGLMFFCFITGASAINSIDAGKKLTEDYTRFAKMQMAYLSDNLGENAVYENMVAEWRKSSYPGIVAIIPYLKENSLGPFNMPLARFIDQHKNLDFNSGQHENCIRGKLTEKMRNNDPLIRNIVFESKNRMDTADYPYLLVYTDKKLSGLAFRKRSSLPTLFQENNVDKSSWLGITRIPSEKETTVVIAFQNERKNCRVELTELSAAATNLSN